MADQSYIKKTVEDLAKRLETSQEEITEAVLKLVEGKTNAEGIKF